MAKGKNKKISKRGKGAKRSDKHPFLKKEWYTLISPLAVKKSIPVGWTVCKKPTGTQVITDFLKGRIAEISYADITNNGRDVTKKIKMIVDEISGKNCATSFYGYELSREKISAMLRKRQSLIEVYSDVKCSDGTIFRVFLVIVTNRRHTQVKLNSYAQHSKIKLLRKKLIAELVKYAAEKTSDEFAFDAITDALNIHFEKHAQSVIPEAKLQVSKIKTVKRSTIDVKALIDGAKQQVTQDGEKMIEENAEATNLLTRDQ